MAEAPENKFFVSVHSDKIIILGDCRVMPREDALNLAAWIVAVADRGEFAELLKAVRNI